MWSKKLLKCDEDIFEELTDPDYKGLMHYSRATYALGCRGPMCRRKERDRALQRNERRIVAQGRPYVRRADEGDRPKEILALAEWWGDLSVTQRKRLADDAIIVRRGIRA